MREVDNIPIKRPTNGFDVFAISVSANPLPNSFNESPIKLILKRKRYKNRSNCNI
jgi:hypothetical protein